MSCLMNLRLQDVPWFSRSEWLEVYYAIFGNKYEDWAEAYKRICVWKVRVPKLPVGIECTIPLLHAQIVLSDNSIESSVQTSVVQLAILRFVTVVTKGYEQRYLIGKKMHDLAEKLKLPHYLIDLRNQIIHSDNIFGSTETYRLALDVCFQWIQINYWKAEEMKHRAKTPFPMNVIKVRKPSVKIIQDNKENKTSSKKLRFLIQNCLLHFTTHCGKDDKSIKEKKLEKLLNLELISYSASNPEDAMNVLVSDLFLSPKMISWLNFIRKDSGSENKCHCKNHSVNTAIKYFASHIHLILEIGCINIFVNSLIGDGKDPDLVRNCWLKYLIKMSIDGSPYRGIFLRANGMNVWKYKYHFKWKQHIYTLFSLGENWTILLAKLHIFEVFTKTLTDMMFYKKLWIYSLVFENKIIRIGNLENSSKKSSES
ncbi:hypothetical protein Anas_10754 [Armadillidium nasatum]|uniref:Ribosomal biogenesis protein LAS1L n=1 Tax=Armadillidium nasatum TaxID=96803 RepID=A0A5N5T5V5_9CRUS|nr:hypothetical protein Anas_10754 [Armadillidium nasatum]